MSNIIDLAQHRQPKTVGGLATPSQMMAAPRGEPSPGNVFNAHSPAFFALPFVTLPSERCVDWAQFWEHASLWNDEPTDDGRVDYIRGKRYARDAIAAIVSDGAAARDLEMVVEAIVARGFSRRGPSGRLCRQLASAETAFLSELCQIAVKAVSRHGFPPQPWESAS